MYLFSEPKLSSVYKKPKKPTWFFPLRVLPKRIIYSIINPVRKRKVFNFDPNNNMPGILKNTKAKTAEENPPNQADEKIVSFGTLEYFENVTNPNRVSYLLAMWRRQAHRDVRNLRLNRILRRAERAACKAKGLYCDESGNVYPYISNMRTFINSAQNAVLMEGYTAARIARFKEKNIVIAPRRKVRKTLAHLAAST